jgi:hypothetical protein
VFTKSVFFTFRFGGRGGCNPATPSLGCTPACWHRLVKDFKNPWHLRLLRSCVYDWATEFTAWWVVIVSYQHVVSVSLSCRLQCARSHLKQRADSYRKLIVSPSNCHRTLRRVQYDSWHSITYPIEVFVHRLATAICDVNYRRDFEVGGTVKL